MICSSPQTYASSFSLPCCRQRIHYECLARSVHACGDRCSFCTQDLVPVLSDPLLAASFEHLNISIDFNAPPANSSLNSLCVPDGLPHPPIFPLCCANSCGPPDFEPLDDRGMEWSPIHPSAQCSSSAWVLQWVCRSCGSSTSMQDIPALPTVSCPQCSSSAAIIFLTGPLDALCVSAFPVNSLSLTTVSAPPPQPPVPPAPALPPNNEPPADWFSHGPLSFFPSLYGWGRGDATPPGSGTQSWLFCPLISLGLALAESRLGVPPYSTGNREQVPSEQSQFWTTHALPIIRAYADHFHSLDRSLPAAWEGGHLDSVAQEVVTPPNIMSMIAVWLSDSVTQFREGVLHTTRLHLLLPLSHHLLTPLCPVTPLTLLLLLKPPAHSLLLLLPVHLGPLLPLCRLQLPLLQGLELPAPPSVVTSPPVPQVSSFSPQSEFGPPRLTRFLKMPLDRYVNVVTSMINDGRFSHIGHCVLRLEGQTAWGVWLRINHWDSSEGRRARLRVGVLYHVGNRTLTFHGSATTVRQLLLPLFQDWTFATLASLPSVSQVPPSSPCAPPPLCQGTPQPVLPSTAASLQPLHSSPVPRLSGAHLAHPSTHFAIRGSSNRSSPHGTCSCLSTSFSPSAPFSLTPCFHTDRGPPSSPCTLPPCHSASTSLSNPALFSSWLHFSCTPALLHGIL